MCGLVGVAGDLSKVHVDAFIRLLVVNQFRGAHSTGIASIGFNPKDVSMLKKVGGPHELFDSHRFANVVNTSRYCLIGHGRFKTIGDATVSNAHPFAFEKLVGAHNGTLHYDYRTDLDDASQFGTDSECLFHNMDKHGERETIAKLTTTDNSGAWALTYYKPEDNTINLIHNEKRPLTFCFSKDRKVMFWASDSSMLSFVLDGLDIEREYVGKHSIWSLPENEIWSWEVPRTNKVFGKPTVSAKVLGKAEVKQAASASFFQGYPRLPWKPAKSTSTERPNTGESKASTISGNDRGSNGSGDIVSLELERTKKVRVVVAGKVIPNRDERGDLMSSDEFKKRTKNMVCDWSGCDLEEGRTVFMSYESAVCMNCADMQEQLWKGV